MTVRVLVLWLAALGLLLAGPALVGLTPVAAQDNIEGVCASCGHTFESHYYGGGGGGSCGCCNGPGGGGGGDSGGGYSEGGGSPFALELLISPALMPAFFVVGFGLGYGLTWLLVERLGWPFWAGLAVVAVAVPALSFLLQRLWAFRQKA